MTAIRNIWFVLVYLALGLLCFLVIPAKAQYSDDFNRSDGSPGANWTGARGTWAISSNRLVQSQGPQGYAPGWHILNSVSSAWDGVSVQAAMYKAGLPDSTTGLIARYSNNSGQISFYTAYIRQMTGADEWRMYKYVNGNYTQIGSTLREEFTNGSTVRLEVTGSSLTMFLWNGSTWVTKISGTDSDLVSGSVGLRASHQGAAFDDFYVAPAGGGSPPITPAPNTIPQSAVTNLVSDLAARVVGPASSTDGALAQFDGTTGKLLKQWTGTGVLKSTSGVPGVVAGSGTDCVLVNGSSQPCATGSGNVTGTGPSVVGYVPTWNNTGATGIGPGYAVSYGTPYTVDGLVRLDGNGTFWANTLQLSGYFFSNTSGASTPAGIFKKHSAGYTGSLVSFVNEGGSEVTAIDASGNFTGRSATTLALSSNPSNCSAGQAAAGIAADGSAEGCFTPAGSGGATGSYTQSFTSQTSVTLAHGLGSKNILVACYDGSDNAIEWNGLTTTSTSAAAVTFTSAQTGRCTVTIGGGSARYSTTFTSQTSVTIAGTTHNLGTPDIHVQCRDSASPRKIVEPNDVTINDSTYDVTITFSVAQSGRCTIL